MKFESYFADHLRVRWQRLRLYHFPGWVLTGYRILKNYIKTIGGAV
ncbi:TPA: YlcG family protein [Citrobacter freundii]|nr:YlcG family protein [Citrobacter freundii]HCD1267367.1 YlcG family protein [Citrobacter freundii]